MYYYHQLYLDFLSFFDSSSFECSLSPSKSSLSFTVGSYQSALFLAHSIHFLSSSVKFGFEETASIYLRILQATAKSSASLTNAIVLSISLSRLCINSSSLRLFSSRSRSSSSRFFAQLLLSLISHINQ